VSFEINPRYLTGKMLGQLTNVQLHRFLYVAGDFLTGAP